MLHRSLPLVLVALALALFLGQPAFADDMHEGKVVKAGDGKLVMTDLQGKNEHTMTVPAAAKITCEGKECKLEDLKAGFTLKVWTKEGNKTEVTKIEAKKPT
jgi:hypothetical protein